MAPEFSNEAIASAARSKKDGQLMISIMETPTTGNVSGLDRDIAALAGSVFIDYQEGMTLETTDPSTIGFVKSLTSTSRETIIVPNGTNSILESHLAYLESQKSLKDDDFYKDRFNERIARLNGKIATVFVGAETQSEVDYLYDVLDDSIKATKNCLKTGYVAGGGITYREISLNLGEDSILEQALRMPFMKLLENSGYSKEEMDTHSRKLDVCEHPVGFDLISEEWTNLIGCGVIEPAGVIENSIKNACSVAILLMSTDSGIVIIPESLI